MSLTEHRNRLAESRRADHVLAVTSLEPLDTTASGGGGTSLTISDCEEILTDAHLGDSISVNGM